MSSFLCLSSGAHRDLHVLTHSFPRRRPSDLGGEALPRRGAQRHLALLAALALDDEQALVALGGREAQADQLRDAQAAGVEQLDQGGEAQRLRPFTLVRLVQKRADLRLAEDLRQRAALARAVDRSAERRVGNGGVSTCRSWWWPEHLKK